VDDPSRSLPNLPAGRMVLAEEGEGQPAFWLSDKPVELGQWARLLAEHTTSGYWPLLLGPADDEGRPWTAGDVWFDGLSSPADHDPQAVLRTWWRRNVEPSLDELAPLGADWPNGPAPTPPSRVDPDEQAGAVARAFLAEYPTTLLGLVAAGSGADALTAIGWQGPMNHVRDTAQISAVLRDWETRYGTRVVALDGVSTLVLSVAAPPVDRDQALRVAAEHFAFCPDNIRQGPSGTTLATYAEKLVEDEFWIFWWD
jgi:Domain of unknown function (DUF4253)